MKSNLTVSFLFQMLITQQVEYIVCRTKYQLFWIVLESVFIGLHCQWPLTCGGIHCFINTFNSLLIFHFLFLFLYLWIDNFLIIYVFISILFSICIVPLSISIFIYSCISFYFSLGISASLCKQGDCHSRPITVRQNSLGSMYINAEIDTEIQ